VVACWISRLAKRFQVNTVRVRGAQVVVEVSESVRVRAVWHSVVATSHQVGPARQATGSGGATSQPEAMRRARLRRRGPLGWRATAMKAVGR